MQAVATAARIPGPWSQYCDPHHGTRRRGRLRAGGVQRHDRIRARWVPARGGRAVRRARTTVLLSPAGLAGAAHPLMRGPARRDPGLAASAACRSMRFSANCDTQTSASTTGDRPRRPSAGNQPSKSSSLNSPSSRCSHQCGWVFGTHSMGRCACVQAGSWTDTGSQPEATRQIAAQWTLAARTTDTTRRCTSRCRVSRGPGCMSGIESCPIG